MKELSILLLSLLVLSTNLASQKSKLTNLKKSLLNPPAANCSDQ